MTEKANPSIKRPAEAFKTAGAIAYGGHGGDGFVVDGANPTDISVQDGGIVEADLNAFAETSSTSSLDVTIDGGEAFVFGTWLSIDTDTTVTLAASSTGQTVYVGWNKNGADDVIIGLSSAFSTATGDTDEKIPLWTFDTDGSGVIASTDERQIGKLTTGSVDLEGGSLFDSTQDYLDLTGENIRAGTGNAIEDGSGGNRIHITSSSTDILDEQSNISFAAASSVGGGWIQKHSGGGRLVYDSEGGFDAVQYDTDASQGTLSLSNAKITTFGGSGDHAIHTPTDYRDLEIHSARKLHLKGDPDSLLAFSGFTISLQGTEEMRISSGDSYIDFTGGSRDLRLATGQAIEDGSGNPVVNIPGTDTVELKVSGSLYELQKNGTDGTGVINFKT